MWEVLRWMIVFVLALLLIVVAIYLVTGRPLPIPSFWTAGPRPRL